MRPLTQSTPGRRIFGSTTDSCGLSYYPTYSMTLDAVPLSVCAMRFTWGSAGTLPFGVAWLTCNVVSQNRSFMSDVRSAEATTITPMREYLKTIS